MCKDAWENFVSLCRSVCVIFSMENGPRKNGGESRRRKEKCEEMKNVENIFTLEFFAFSADAWIAYVLFTFAAAWKKDLKIKFMIYHSSIATTRSYIGSGKASMYAAVVWKEWKSWQPRNYTWDFISHSSNFIPSSSYLLCSNLMTFPAGIFIIYHFLHANTIFSLFSHICSKPETFEHMERECENLRADN